MFNKKFNPFCWYNKFGTIPSEFREAMSYEEQILWLCQQIETLKNNNPNVSYTALQDKPIINGVTLQGSLSLDNLGIQPTLVAR